MKLNNLPAELLTLIGTELRGRERASFRATCKKIAAVVPREVIPLDGVTLYYASHFGVNKQARIEKSFAVQADSHTGRKYLISLHENSELPGRRRALPERVAQEIPAFVAGTQAMRWFAARVGRLFTETSNREESTEIARVAAHALRGQAEIGILADYPKELLLFVKISDLWCREMGADTGLPPVQGRAIDMQLPLAHFTPRILDDLLSRNRSVLLQPGTEMVLSPTGPEGPYAKGALFALSLRAIAEVALYSGTSESEVDQFLENTRAAIWSSIWDASNGREAFAMSYDGFLTMSIGIDAAREKWMQGAASVLTRVKVDT